MLYIEKLVRHFRQVDGDEIFWRIFIGFTSIMIAVLVVLSIYGLITWLGIWIILFPFAVVAALLIVYGIGWIIGNIIEKYESSF